MLKILDKETLYLVDGGFSLSGTLINALTGGLKFIVDLGRNLGSGLRRMRTNNYCSL